jgi:hypothetical protein
MSFPSPPHTLKNWEVRTSNFNKDLETRLQWIMCSKWSQHISNPTPYFLLLITIKCEKFITMKSQTLFNFGASLCFINKELEWKHWWRRQTKVLVITIGSHFNKIIFNVISSVTNLIIIGLSWFTLYNPWMDWHTKNIILNHWMMKHWNARPLFLIIFGVDHDYHMDVFKRGYKGWLMGANSLRCTKILS